MWRDLTVANTSELAWIGKLARESRGFFGDRLTENSLSLSASALWQSATSSLQTQHPARPQPD